MGGGGGGGGGVASFAVYHDQHFLIDTIVEIYAIKKTYQH